MFVIRLSVCVSACLSVASHISWTREAIAIKFYKVTASVMAMHKVFFSFTLTFTQGHIDLNHENNKCSIISETIQAMPIKFAMNIVRLKVGIIFASPMTLTFNEGYNEPLLKLYNC